MYLRSRLPSCQPRSATPTHRPSLRLWMLPSPALRLRRTMSRLAEPLDELVQGLDGDAAQPVDPDGLERARVEQLVELGSADAERLRRFFGREDQSRRAGGLSVAGLAVGRVRLPHGGPLCERSAGRGPREAWPPTPAIPLRDGGAGGRGAHHRGGGGEDRWLPLQGSH